MKRFFSPQPQHFCQMAGSGQISLGDGPRDRSVNCELSLAGTAAICMDRADVRTLAGRAGSGTQICMNNFYSKRANPGPVGQAYKGGNYINNSGGYYLIVSSQADGDTTGTWKNTRSATGSNSAQDGFDNTYSFLANASHPSGNFCATRTINGFSDWYMPASNELNVMRTNSGPQPGGFGFSSARYWSSTDPGGQMGCTLNFPGGAFDANRVKNYTYRVRAIRRVLI